MGLKADRSHPALASHKRRSGTTGKRIEEKIACLQACLVAALMDEFGREAGDKVEPAMNRVLVGCSVGRYPVRRQRQVLGWSGKLDLRKEGVGNWLVMQSWFQEGLCRSV